MKHPIVLAHGIARLDVLTTKLSKPFSPWLGDRFHYFRGVASHLQKAGFEAYHANVSFAANLATRANDLAKEVNRILQESGAEKVHIIGHSMGGLDARYMIFSHDMAGSVASLSTVGTPHNGTAIADWTLQHGGHQLISSLEKYFDLTGFEDLQRERCRHLNARLEASEAKNDVRYIVYGSWQEQGRILLPFRFSANIISDAEGRSDGLVSLQSQLWTGTLHAPDGSEKQVEQHEFPMRADHINQMGWWHVNYPPKNRPFFRRLFRGKGAYETRVKNIYLDIAKRAMDMS